MHMLFTNDLEFLGQGEKASASQEPARHNNTRKISETQAILVQILRIFSFCKEKITVSS